MRQTGVVRWFDDRKGYGMIALGDKGVFVHYSQIVGEGFQTLIAGQSVEFDLVTPLAKHKGLQAENVRKL